MRTTSELSRVLEEFCSAFTAQDADRLRAVFTDEPVCFIASEAIELRDRSHLEQFIDAYTGQPMRFSFGWDDWDESLAGDAG